MIYSFFAVILSVFFAKLESSVISYQQALSEYSKNNLSVPEKKADGRVHTLNRKGAESASFDHAMRMFLDFGKGKNILEIGGCYGKLMWQALKQSKETHYTLNDIEKNHLFIAAEILSGKIQAGWLDRESINRVTFAEFDISDAKAVSNLGQYDAIYVGKVFHFLTPEQFETAVENLFLLLKPGGRIFVTALSPYMKHFEKFIPEYLERVKAGDKYPGFIESSRKYIDLSESTPLQISSMLDDTFLFLDETVLKRAFEEKKRFKVLSCHFTPLTHKSKLWSLDGKEYVYLVAEKNSSA